VFTSPSFFPFFFFAGTATRKGDSRDFSSPSLSLFSPFFLRFFSFFPFFLYRLRQEHEDRRSRLQRVRPFFFSFTLSFLPPYFARSMAEETSFLLFSFLSFLENSTGAGQEEGRRGEAWSRLSLLSSSFFSFFPPLAPFFDSAVGVVRRAEGYRDARDLGSRTPNFFFLSFPSAFLVCSFDSPGENRGRCASVHPGSSLFLLFFLGLPFFPVPHKRRRDGSASD